MTTKNFSELLDTIGAAIPTPQTAEEFRELASYLERWNKETARLRKKFYWDIQCLNTKEAAEKKGLVIPDNMVPTPQEGYFWCKGEQCVYSCKIAGQFIPLSKKKLSSFTKYHKAFQRVEEFYFNTSDKGRHRLLPDTVLKEL